MYQSEYETNWSEYKKKDDAEEDTSHKKSKQNCQTHPDGKEGSQCNWDQNCQDHEKTAD